MSKYISTPESRAKHAAYMRAYSAIPLNNAKKRASQKKRRDKIASKILMREYREAHKEEIMRVQSIWKKANVLKVREYERLRKIRLHGNGGKHSIEEWEEKKAAYSHKCAYCDKEKPLTRDHIIPITRGGSDNIENVIPACVSCNSSKNYRPVEQFLANRKAA